METKSPKYRLVMQYIYDYIRSRRLDTGAKLPTEKELCDLLSVSADTVHRAMKHLVEEGVLIRRRGSGCYVARPAESPAEIPSCFHLIVADWVDHTGSKLYAQGAREYFAERGCSLEIHNVERDLYHELLVIRQLKEQGIRHILIVPSMLEWSGRELNSLAADGMVFTFLDRRSMGVSGDLAETDNAGGMRTLCENLIHLGHRNILFVAQRPTFLTSEQGRLEGYKAALAMYEIPLKEENIICSRDFQELLKKRLESEDRPTVVAASNDDTAIYAIQIAESLGLRVPEDLSVTGFDGLGLQRDGTPPLTGVLQPFKEIGRRAAELAYRRYLHPEDHLIRTVTVPVDFVAGKTVRKISQE